MRVIKSTYVTEEAMQSIKENWNKPFSNDKEEHNKICREIIRAMEKDEKERGFIMECDYMLYRKALRMLEI